MAGAHNHWDKTFYADNANFRLGDDGKDYCRTCGKWVQGRATQMRPEIKQRAANRRKGLTSKQYQANTDRKSRARTVRGRSGTVATTEPAYLPARTATGRRGTYPNQQERAGVASTKRARTKVGKTRRTAAKPYRPRHARRDEITPGYGY